MSTLDPRRARWQEEAGRPEKDRLDAEDSSSEERHGHGGHSRWMMIVCCIPMLAIAVALVAAGAGVGFLIIALLCTAMMALMMGGMSHGGKGDRQ